MTARRVYLAVLLLAPVAAAALRNGSAITAQSGPKPPAYKVDPFWPKPLPTVRDADGLAHAWVTGEVGASCIDSHDHIITVNRGFLKNGLLAQEGTQSIPAPPVIVFDAGGNLVNSWGDASLTATGAAAVLPNGIH